MILETLKADISKAGNNKPAMMLRDKNQYSQDIATANEMSLTDARSFIDRHFQVFSDERSFNEHVIKHGLDQPTIEIGLPLKNRSKSINEALTTVNAGLETIKAENQLRAKLGLEPKKIPLTGKLLEDLAHAGLFEDYIAILDSDTIKSNSKAISDVRAKIEKQANQEKMDAKIKEHLSAYIMAIEELEHQPPVSIKKGNTVAINPDYEAYRKKVADLKAKVSGLNSKARFSSVALQKELSMLSTCLDADNPFIAYRRAQKTQVR